MEYKGFCLCCERDNRDLESIEIFSTFKVYGEMVRVSQTMTHCHDCGKAFSDINVPVEEAFREYRRRHNWLQAEEITARREQLNMSTRRLADLICCDEATILRYEAGTDLQTPEQEAIMRHSLG